MTWVRALLIASLVALLALPGVCWTIRDGRLLARDDFSRASAGWSGAVPGTPYSWRQRLPQGPGGPVAVISASDGVLSVGYSSTVSPYDPGVWLDGLTPADGVLSVTVGPSAVADRGHAATLSYRAADPQAAAGGREPGAYHVEVRADWSGSRDLVLCYGTEVLAAADLGTSFPPTATLRLCAAFVGDRHAVSVNGKQVLTYREWLPGRTSAGYAGFGGFYSTGAFDDFELREARLVGGDDLLVRRAPLEFQGRPMFVLGTYDQPDPEDTAEWLAAGCNATIESCLQETTAQARRQRLEELADWASRYGVAMCYYPVSSPYSHIGDQTVLTTAEDLPQEQAMYQELLAVTAAHPQTFGYWTLDEPENHLGGAYQDFDAKQDDGLAEWIAQGMKWTYDTLKAGAPRAYVMPTIAWWTTYVGLAPLYDVNVPNEYPQAGAAFEGPLYNVVYDAAKAIEAADATGKPGVIYMPGTFDIIAAPYRAATVAELRYMCFAPLTQGAVGLLPWRLGRCSPAYRHAAVYPVIREVKGLLPWLMGKWQEGMVTSDHDRASAPYLQEFPVRVKTVAGEETTETVRVDGVPDCSYMVRRRPDNTFLLLAVSNRREPLEVTFTLSGMGTLPATAREMLQWDQTPIADGRITTAFEPFGVRAWVISPK